MPEAFSAVAQTTDLVSSAVYGIDWRTGTPHVWYETRQLNGRLHLAGAWRAREDFERWIVSEKGPKLSLYAPLAEAASWLGFTRPPGLPSPDYVFRSTYAHSGWLKTYTATG